MRKSIIFQFIFLLLVTNFFGCSIFDSNDDENNPSFSIVENINGNFDAAIANEEHDILFGISYDSQNRLDKSVFVNEQGDAATTWFREDGLPERLIIGESVIVFSNYTDTHFDVLGISESGEIFIEREVEIPEELMVYRDTFVTLNGDGAFKKALSIDSNTINRIGWAWDGTTCAVSAALVKPTFGLSLPFAVSACGSLGLRAAAEFTDSHAIQYSATAWNLGWCTHADPTACISLGLDVLEHELGQAETVSEYRREEIAQGTGSLNFGGIWDYQNFDAYFVMEINRAFDAVYNSSNDCYELTILNFLESDGNVFLYEREIDGFEIEAEFELINENELRATRLNDGAQFFWDREHTLTVSYFENNSCSFKILDYRDKTPGSLTGI